MDFDPKQLPPEYFQTRVRDLEAQVSAQTAALRKIEAELEWWRQGLALFSDKSAASESGSVPVAPVGSSPAQMNGKKPALRDAILRVFRDVEPLPDGGEREWRAVEVIHMLSDRGWLPNGKNADNTVREMLRDMDGRGQLKKVGYGTFQLPEGHRTNPFLTSGVEP